MDAAVDAEIECWAVEVALTDAAEATESDFLERLPYDGLKGLSDQQAREMADLEEGQASRVDLQTLDSGSVWASADALREFFYPELSPDDCAVKAALEKVSQSI